MIITSGVISKKELRIKLFEFLDIEVRLIRGQNVRIVGLDGDVVFLTTPNLIPEQSEPEYVTEVEQLT